MMGLKTSKMRLVGYTTNWSYKSLAGSSSWVQGIYLPVVAPVYKQAGFGAPALSGPRRFKSRPDTAIGAKVDPDNLSATASLLEGFDLKAAVASLPTASTLFSELLADFARGTTQRTINPLNVFLRSLGSSNVAGTALSAVSSAFGIKIDADITYGTPMLQAAFTYTPFQQVTEQLGLAQGSLPGGGKAATAEAIAGFMVQPQLMADEDALRDGKQSTLEDQLTAIEKFKLPNGNEVSHKEYLDALGKSFIGTGGSGTVKFLDAYFAKYEPKGLSIPSGSVISSLYELTVGELLNSDIGTKSTPGIGNPFKKYLYGVIVAKFPAYLPPNELTLFNSDTDSNMQAIAEIVRTAYSQSDALGQYLRMLGVYVKNLATLSQPIDIGLSPEEGRIASFGIKLISAINAQAAKFTTVESRKDLTLSQIAAIDKAFDDKREAVYFALPLARICTITIAQVPPAFVGRLRRLIAGDKGLAVRSKALTVRAFRILEYARYCEARASGTTYAPLDFTV